MSANGTAPAVEEVITMRLTPVLLAADARIPTVPFIAG